MRIILQTIKALFRKVENAIKSNASAIVKLSSKITSVQNSLDDKVNKSIGTLQAEVKNVAELATKGVISITTTSVETNGSKKTFVAQSPYVTNASKYTEDMIGMLFSVNFHDIVDKPSSLKINNLPALSILSPVTKSTGEFDMKSFVLYTLNGKWDADVKVSILVRLNYWYSSYVFEVVGDYSSASSKVYYGVCTDSNIKVDKTVTYKEYYTNVFEAYIMFALNNSAENPTLNVDGTKYPICDAQGNPISPDAIQANTMYHFVKFSDFEDSKVKWFMLS